MNDIYISYIQQTTINLTKVNFIKKKINAFND